MTNTTISRIFPLVAIAISVACGENTATHDATPPSLVQAAAHSSHSIVLSVRPAAGPGLPARYFRDLGSWKYQPDKATWTKFAERSGKAVSIRPAAASRELLVTDVDSPGLFSICWEESGHRYVALIPVGGILCNDLSIGQPPEDMVAACIPFADRGVASFVPDPLPLCF